MKYITILLYLIIVNLMQAQDISNLINTYTNSYVKTGDFSGCILIAENDNILYENCFGLANQSFQIPNKLDTKFIIGSISKQFTAAAILILEQEGYLKTTDTIAKYFKTNPISENITIEQLLTHTSGITDIYNVPDFSELSCKKITLSNFAQLVLDTKLDFTPGTQYQYSNGGYTLLAALIEKISGTTYQDFLSNRIFQPLKMMATGHASTNEVIPDLAVGYDPLRYDKLKITNYLDFELLKGSGSLYSTVYDLRKWVKSIKKRTLLNSNSYDKFLKDYGQNYGYGISLYNSFGHRVFGHDGRVNGYIADYLHYKEPNIDIIILGNTQTGVADFFRRDIAAIVFGKEYKSRAKQIPPDEKTRLNPKKIIGTYAFGPNFKVYIELIDGRIQARANEGAYSELIRLEDQRFFSRTLYSYIKFMEDDSGSITKMVWTNNDGNTFEGVKE